MLRFLLRKVLIGPSQITCRAQAHFSNSKGFRIIHHVFCQWCLSKVPTVCCQHCCFYSHRSSGRCIVFCWPCWAPVFTPSFSTSECHRFIKMVNWLAHISLPTTPIRTHFSIKGANQLIRRDKKLSVEKTFPPTIFLCTAHMSTHTQMETAVGRNLRFGFLPKDTTTRSIAATAVSISCYHCYRIPPSFYTTFHWMELSAASP